MNVNSTNPINSFTYFMKLKPKNIDGRYTIKLDNEKMNNYLCCSDFLNKELDDLLNDFKIEVLNKLSNEEIFLFNSMPSFLLKDKTHPLKNLVYKKEKVLVDIINHSMEFNDLFEGDYVINNNHLNQPEVNFFFSFNKYEHLFSLNDESLFNEFKTLIKTKEITDKIKGF